MSGDLQRTLGANLRAFRQTKGWSQDICAEIIGVSRPHLGSIERGHTSVRLGTLERIADRLGVPAVDLLTEG